MQTFMVTDQIFIGKKTFFMTIYMRNTPKEWIQSKVTHYYNNDTEAQAYFLTIDKLIANFQQFYKIIGNQITAQQMMTQICQMKSTFAYIIEFDCYAT